MPTRDQPYLNRSLLFGIIGLLGLIALPRPALAQGGDAPVVVAVPQIDMWECANRQNFFNYPAGSVTGVTLNADSLAIDLAGVPGDVYSFAVVARIDSAGGSERASYQIHDGTLSSGYLDPTSGFPIPGTEFQVTITNTGAVSTTIVVEASPSILDEIENMKQEYGNVISGTLTSGQMPPIQDGDPSLYVQVNTFYLPTANDVRACGEYLVYFTPAALASNGKAEGIHDGLLCNSGVKPFALPDGMDLTNASVTVDDGEQQYVFKLEFGRVETLELQFAGGVEFYDPAGEIPGVDPNWLFNYTGNWSFNFAYTPPDKVDLFASQYSGGDWTSFPEPDHTVTINGNVIEVFLRSDQLPDTTADWTWFATVTNFSVCDEIGLGVDLLPELPFPELAAQQLEPTATITPSPTATVTPLPSATPTATPTPESPQPEPAPEDEGEEPEPWYDIPFCTANALIVGVISFFASKTAGRRKLRS